MVSREGQLTARGRCWLIFLTLFYAVLIALVCFIPQPDLLEIETPGIQRFGRVIVLLRPFNTVWGWQEVPSVYQLAWVIVQNLMNIFLLYPLVLGLLLLQPTLRQPRMVLMLGFSISLFIELTQIVLDVLLDANRVFEVDDLWTNTLGAYLALLTYRYLVVKGWCSISDAKGIKTADRALPPQEKN